MESGLEGRNNHLDQHHDGVPVLSVSMESGLEGRNNAAEGAESGHAFSASQWSPA